MAKRKRKKYGRRHRSLGLAGLSSSKKFDVKNAGKELGHIVLIGAGAFAAAKGISMLDKMVNKGGSKIMGFIAPGIATVAGIGVATVMGNEYAKSLGKGIAVGGAIKLAEKAMNKENLLAGVDEPLMLPGIGDMGYAELPELSHYSENPDAYVTTTGGDPQYVMGQPSEVLGGDDEIEAY